MIKTDFSIQKCAKERIIMRKDKSYASTYRSLIKGLGSQIIQNGLYGTLVFLDAKNKEHHKAVSEDIIYFLKESNIYTTNDHIYDFLEKENNLMLAQDKVLEFVGWYRRFADIFIRNDKNTGSDNS
ncbi:hypothetical protein OSSY52_18980 [Tepiditoga spiralis]|uniref:CRISPR type III-B/RAMP module-associated protein Cmr5 n=1 Tax=Tepiditoga spiralis TaxID=2108365 RepID=A0A7G1G9U3_9BACT|nr:type III-B CRISPR module-associated protein Cmr5 [Tepiditoga spiralis]BBE31757.1 hypothetical protein OSSY52_18980 [Tepiditoga spiralis]